MSKSIVQKNFKSKIESAIYDITGKFIKTQIIQHSATKGQEREDPLIEFLNENLPKKYSVVKGEVVDLFNKTSPQMDVMIFDNTRNIPLYSDGAYILPAEALLASIEVKSKMTLNEVEKILKNVQKLKSLKPFKKKLDSAVLGRSLDDKVVCRYFHCVFAYDTDLAEKDWASKEVERIRNKAEEKKIDSTLIDRIFVMNKGLINMAHSKAKSSKDNSETLLYFYMSILNFIERENGRRKTVPYMEYSGTIDKGWTSI
jgi:hypothetical protein